MNLLVLFRQFGGGGTTEEFGTSATRQGVCSSLCPTPAGVMVLPSAKPRTRSGEFDGRGGQSGITDFVGRTALGLACNKDRIN